MKENLVSTHKKIIYALRHMTEENNNGIVKISKLASTVKADIRTIKKHLELAEIHDIGKFLDDEKTIFCVRKPVHMSDKDQQIIR